MGLKLREAMLLNGILYNIEIWYNLKEEEIKKLSELDEYLLRCILGVPSKTPIEALFLESGCIPIKYILKMRRVMYLHHILRRPNNELIKKFYEAQKCKMSQGDWAETVSENIKELNLNLTDEQISKMLKYKFKMLLKKSILNEVFNYLIGKKKTHSKLRDIKYQKFEIQTYLKSNSGLSNEDKWLLMKFRTRMSEMKNIFRNRYEKHLCQLCLVEKDDQIHLFE